MDTPRRELAFLAACVAAIVLGTTTAYLARNRTWSS